MEDHLLSILPTKAKYGHNKNYISVNKDGYLLIDFIPLEMSNGYKRPDFTKKEGILLDPKKSLQLTIFDLKKKEEFEFYHQYVSKDKSLRIKGIRNLKNDNIDNKNLDYFLEFDYFNEIDDKHYTSKLNMVDGIIIQKMIDYSFPFMLGWHVLNSNNFAFEDMDN